MTLEDKHEHEVSCCMCVGFWRHCFQSFPQKAIRSTEYSVVSHQFRHNSDRAHCMPR